jgi:hypothetical protein
MVGRFGFFRSKLKEINKKQITAMKNINLNNLFKRKVKKEDYNNPAVHSMRYIRDWKILVIIFALGLAVLSFFAWRIYLSNQIAAGYLKPIIEENSYSNKIIDIKKLKANILIMENKQTEFLQNKANQLKIVDPAL